MKFIKVKFKKRERINNPVKLIYFVDIIHKVLIVFVDFMSWFLLFTTILYSFFAVLLIAYDYKVSWWYNNSDKVLHGQ